MLQGEVSGLIRRIRIRSHTHTHVMSGVTGISTKIENSGNKAKRLSRKDENTIKPMVVFSWMK